MKFFPLPSTFVLAAALGVAIPAPTALAAPVTYAFDTVHSRVTFHVSHLGFSHSLGQLFIAPGTFVFDTADWSKGRVTATMPADSLTFGDAKWDAHVKSADFLDAARFPNVTFTATEVKQTGESTGTLSGDLTVHGVTRPVTLQLRLNAATSHPLRKVPAIGFTARGLIKRSDFGVAAYVPMVGDELEVRIEVEALQAP
ncbi:MAG: YceI family protein [Gammaproteobacteria bacterium]